MKMTMDLTLFPSLIQDLLIKNESFILPGAGKFSVEATPATFLEGGKGILPPGKKLVFEHGDFQGDFSPWQEELKGIVMESLAADGRFELPGFGVFTDKGEGMISFEVSPEFDFAPDSFSLEAIALEVMNPVPEPEQFVEPELVAAEEPEARPEPDSEEIIVELHKEPQEEPAPEKHDVAHNAVQKQKWILWCAIALIAVLIVVLFALLFKEPLAEALKNILYSKEELEIIRQWQAQ